MQKFLSLGSWTSESSSATLLLMMTLVLVVQQKVVVVSAHDCIHDSAEIQRYYHDGMDKVFPRPPQPDEFERKNSVGGAHASERSFNLQSAQGPIRFVLRTEDLYNDRYCTSASGTAPDFKGQNSACTSSDDIFTPEKRNLLLNYIMPAALQKIQNMMSISQRTSNIVVPGDCGGQVTIPATDKTTGVPNADYVLYMSAGKTEGNTLAWAGYCYIETTEALPNKGRAFIGRANFGPANIKWNTTTDENGDPENYKSLRTAVHELIHALGMSKTYIQSYMDVSFVTTSFPDNVRGNAPTMYLLTSNTLAATRDFFNCSSIPGTELEFGESQDGGSHWNRRTFYEEIMSPVVGNSRISNFTMSFFKDTGYYTINRTATENDMVWGKDSGCGFLTEKCNTESGGLGSFFCDDTTRANACTYNLGAIGKCDVGTYTQNFPSYWQYFSSNPRYGGTSKFMDYCPIVEKYSNRVCDNDALPEQNDDVFGYFYTSAGGRCFDAPIIKKPFSSPSMSHFRCLKTRCVRGHYIQLQIGGVALNGMNSNQTDWFNCPMNGSAAAISPPDAWSGTVNCPDASSFCTPDLYFDPSSGEETTTTTTSVITTTNPSTLDTTTVAPAVTTVAPMTTTETPAATSTTTAQPTSCPDCSGGPSQCNTTTYECMCPPGVLGTLCDVFCPGSDDNNNLVCSGHGVCGLTPTGTAVCTCEVGWSEQTNCTSCSEDTTGPKCDIRCPVCQNGICVKNETHALCSCAEGYEGELCDNLLATESPQTNAPVVDSSTTTTITVTTSPNDATTTTNIPTTTASTAPATTTTAPPAVEEKEFKGTFATTGANVPSHKGVLAENIAQAMNISSSQVLVTEFNLSSGTYAFEFTGSDAANLTATAETMQASQFGLLTMQASAVSAETPSPSTSDDTPVPTPAPFQVLGQTIDFSDWRVIAAVSGGGLLLLIIVIVIIKKATGGGGGGGSARRRAANSDLDQMMGGNEYHQHVNSHHHTHHQQRLPTNHYSGGRPQGNAFDMNV